MMRSRIIVLSILLYFFLPVAPYIATGSQDESIKIWEEVSGNMLATLNDTENRCSPKVILAINDCILASGTTCSTIDLWDLEIGKIVVRLQGHTGRITSLKLFKNNILASGSSDNTIRLWNIDTYTLIATLNETFWVLSLEIIDEETLACGLNDGSISIYSMKNSTKIKTIVHSSDSVTSLLLLKDGSLASGDQFYKINIWNTKTWTVMKSTIDIGAYRMVQYGEDNLYFIGRAYYFHRLNLKTMEVSTITKEMAYESMRLLCGGLLALGGQTPYELHIWNLTNETYYKTNQGHDSAIFSVEEVKMYPVNFLSSTINTYSTSPTTFDTNSDIQTSTTTTCGTKIEVTDTTYTTTIGTSSTTQTSNIVKISSTVTSRQTTLIQETTISSSNSFCKLGYILSLQATLLMFCLTFI